MLTLEQVTAAQKANVESLIALTTQTFAGLEKVVELNLATAKATVSDAQAQAQALLNVKDAQEFMAMQAGQLQPLAEKANAYGRKLYEIASTSGTEIRKTFESKVSEAQTVSAKKR